MTQSPIRLNNDNTTCHTPAKMSGIAAIMASTIAKIISGIIGANVSIICPVAATMPKTSCITPFISVGRLFNSALTIAIIIVGKASIIG